MQGLRIIIRDPVPMHTVHTTPSARRRPTVAGSNKRYSYRGHLDKSAVPLKKGGKEIRVRNSTFRRTILSVCYPRSRHTFAYRLAAETGTDAYELERRLGHSSQRYIQRYTNPPEDVAAGYVEEF